jgi:hypothetical protein
MQLKHKSLDFLQIKHTSQINYFREIALVGIKSLLYIICNSVPNV